MERKQERLILDDIFSSLHSMDRVLKLSPAEGRKRAAKLARKTRNERVQIADTIEKTIKELEEFNECRTINSVITQHNEQTRIYDRTTNELDELSAEFNHLKESIENTKIKKEKELVNSKKLYAQAKADLQKANQSYNIDQPTSFANREAALNSIRRACQAEEAKVQSELNDLLLKKDQETKTYNLTMKFLKKKLKSVLKSVEEWNIKKETILPDMRAQLEKTQQDHAEMRQRLLDMETAYVNEKQMKKDRLQKIEDDKRRIVLTNRAALTIQRNFRGWRVRNNMRKEKDDKKKKKGKGKKGKGKK